MQRNILLRIVVVALLLYALANFAAVRGDLRRTEKLAEDYGAQVQRLRGENETLRLKLEQGMSDEEYIQLARERLGLVMPGEKIFYFIGPSD